ncbi:MAG: hypothetical protein IT363_14165 [Methanoregulaceae archaeon]|nr:hypothetical protein [Methanoregulaceae archaeon]
MSRPSKKDIKAAVEKLKEKPSAGNAPEPQVGKLPAKKDTKRIRKQGV